MLARPTFWHLEMSWGYLVVNVCFSTSQPCLQHEYTTWMFMHLILFIWYLKGLPNFNIVFINISLQLSCNFTPFLGIYQEILLSCMILTYLCKIHNGVVFFVGSLDVMRPDKDKDKHCQIIFHNAKLYIQLSLWYVYLKLCINICHYFFFFNYLSGECIPNYHENAWIKSYSFHLHGPCCEVSPFNVNIFQSLIISMEDVMVIAWNIRIILLRLWW